ncbi:unnamed protein product, partial [Brenthis ino]
MGSWCINEIEPCDPLEGRKLDGSCINIKHPTRGAAHTPTLRLLPAEYDKDFEPRKAKSGDPLPLARSVRTTVLAEGRISSSTFTQLLTHFWVFISADVVSVHDTVNYIKWTPYCCEEKGKTDKKCTPIKIPDDDPVHRFSSIRCFNLTRPESFQSRGCLKNDTSPERITTATPLFDLSHLYGTSLKTLNAKSRQLEKGLLKIEVANGKIWPPSVKGKDHVCFLNQLPQETRCHDLPESGGNSVLGINLFTIWSWRLHNRVATGLAEVNPCWNDDKLFFTAREIVIAIIMQIYYYELSPALMGYDNLIKAGVLSPKKEFRDLYDNNSIPQITLEFPYVLRWAHTIQEGNLKMYDENGIYLKETKIVNLTLRTGYLDENLEYITHGVFRQPSAKFDYVIDPDVGEFTIGPHQTASDVLTSDLTKNRYFGFAPYVQYRKLCSGKTYRTFDDLSDVIDSERIQLLKEKYKHIEDIDLMAGIWSERLIKGGYVPSTLYCVVVDQMYRNIVTDRHWYERPNRPNAFTLGKLFFIKKKNNFQSFLIFLLTIYYVIEQLLEVRKASIAQIMCAVADKVTTIQPHAFFMPGPGWCINEIIPCNPYEGRRFDGSCYNLKYPSRGAAHTPNLRLLPADYDTDFEPRKAKSGEPLPLPRSVRTTLLAEGRVPDSTFTQLLPHFWLFVTSDILSVHDTVNYVRWTPHCCQEKGKTDKKCIQMKIPDDDPVHRFSSIRCFNLTRPHTFQNSGCLKNDTVPERITSASPIFDLSQIYGMSLKVLNTKSRKFEKGLLKFEVSNGKIWPPSAKGKHLCTLNQLPHETRCHDIPEIGGNSVLGANLFTIWTWRLHNHIASGLAEINPCWDDERLFFTTRELVIAINMQIYYYELLPALMGYDNLVQTGVLSPTNDFRDIYDDNIVPQISLEFPHILRWAHTIQEGTLKMYDTNGVYLKETKLVNLTLRTGYLEDNLEYITQGAFRQPSGKVDYVIDPDMAESALAGHQAASDVFTSDLTKNRYFGFAPYVQYRKLCSGKTYRTFDDLYDVIDPERIELLKEKYKHVEDIDLIAGVWLERPIEGGYAPPTLYCIVVDQMYRNIVSDRHWYERPNRPNAFSIDQLLEIRKTSVAQIMCAVADKVTTIQPHAFFLPGPG